MSVVSRTPQISILIYALCDPITGAIRYIGRSKNPVKRLRQHISRSKCITDHRRKSRWIRTLLNQNLMPALFLLERTSVELCNQAERCWIAYYTKAGADLTNHTIGGDGVVSPDVEARSRLSVTMRRLWQTDILFQEKMRRVYQDPERRRKISAALTGKPKSPEHIAKLSQNKPGWHHSEYAKTLISQALVGNQNAKGFQHSPETKDKLRQVALGNRSRKGQHQSQEERNKKSKALRGRPKSLDHREKIRQGQLRAWARRKAGKL